MPNIWLTADPHFGHRLVAELRGFDSIEAHDDAIIAGWQAVVRPGDQVWVLGDVVVSASSLDHGLAILRDLPGVKDLVAGNHDACHPMHRRAHLTQGRYLEVFRSVQAFARRRLAGRDVLLSHFPYAGDHTNERYTQYRLRDEGLPLLHGHTHSTERQRGREIHVGLDAWGFRPVALGQIESLIRQLPEEG